MPKKIFDIIPPKKDKIVLEEKRTVKRKKPFLKIFLFSAILLIVLGIASFLLFSEVKIEIRPKIETLSFQETIIIDSAINQREGFLLPGQILMNEQSGSKESSASGKAVDEQKAKGVIKVYNAYSESARTLVSSRFVSADGKLFWSIQKIKIPGLTYDKGKVVPGETEVEVEAAETGEEYNIGPTTFALPALAGTALYTTIYARSFSSMSGGFKGEVAQITKQDLEIAKKSLFEELKDQNKNYFKGIAFQGLVFLEETVSDKIIEENSSKNSGDITDLFVYNMKIESRTFVFKQSDIQDFVNEQIDSKIEQSQIVKENSLKINYSIKEIDLKAGKLVLDVNIEVQIYKDINLDDVEKAVSGKSFEQTLLLLNGLPGIEEVDIKSWFLRKSVPEDLEKIKVILKVDEGLTN